jgi:periplasmic protein TonB
MNDSVQTASPFLDEPWRRLAWIAPLSVAIWAAVLLGFALLVKEAAAPLPELKPIEARIVELPPEVGGLQGGPAAAPPHPIAPAPPKPKPHVEVRRKVAPPVHPRKERIIPEAPPSLSGTRKAPAESSTTATKAATSGSAESAATPQGKEGPAGGSGLGNDSLGARAIYSPVPKIPDDLREVAFEAVAVAHFEVSYDGNVKVTLAKPTADPRLNQILLDSLQQWRFFPAMKGGVATDSAFDVRIPISVQ